ncbi:MAG: hypothetical protein AB1589_45285 [Cyanobacteriota bacterium]
MTDSFTSSVVLTLPEFQLDTPTSDTITLNILEGNIFGTVNVDPLAGMFIIPELEELLELEPGSIPSTQTFSQNLQGASFTVPNNPAHYEDGDITLDFPVVSNLFGFTPTTSIEQVFDLLDVDITDTVQDILDALEITDAQDGVDLLDGLFNITVTDDDDNTPENNNDFLTTETGVTSFDFSYNSTQNALVIDGFDVDVVDGVLIGEATIEASGNYSINLVLSEFLNVIEEISEPLNYSLSPSVTSAISYYQLLYGDELPVVSGSFDLDVTTAPAA